MPTPIDEPAPQDDDPRQHANDAELLAVAAIVGGSVYLRQRSSPESKPVAAPHAKTGA